MIKWLMLLVLLGNTALADEMQILRDTHRSIVSVYEPENEDMGYRGTGFFVRAASGKLVVLTVAHVCMHHETMRIKTHDNQMATAKVVALSNKSDMCLLQTKIRRPPLPIGARIMRHEKAYIVSKPYVDHLSITSGRAVSVEFISQVRISLPKHLCLEPGFKWSQIRIGNTPIGVYHCHINSDFILFSAPTAPGASGGPIVNENGQLISMTAITASLENMNWAFGVRLSDIVDLLRKH